MTAQAAINCRWSVVFIACLAAAAAAARLQSGEPEAEPSSQPAARPTQAEATGAADDDYELAPALSYANLEIFPVVSRIPRDEDRFLTLAEALEAGVVSIKEMGTRLADEDDSPRGDVNRLLVTNFADKSLYLMPGETLLGGKQDRCVARESIVAPGGKPVSVEVYCVEHGRWTPGRLGGSFAQAGGQVNLGTRKKVQGGKAQQDVWDEVEAANAASQVSSRTGAYTANFSDQRIKRRLAPYMARLQGSVPSQERIVGVVVAINGRAVVAEIFGSTPLFRKLFPALLVGYAWDAAHVAEGDEAAAACPIEEASAFLFEAFTAEPAQRVTDGDVTVTHHRHQRAVITTAEDAQGTVHKIKLD